MSQAILPLMNAYERGSARAAYLLQDAFPSTSAELLPEWESSLGLPGPYASIATTEAQLQQLVASRFASGGGQSAAYFIGFAKTLGYTITITQFRPMTAGQPVGGPVYGDAWAYAWQVNAPTYVVDYLRAGDTIGQPLASWGNTIMQTELTRLKPAHTYLLFNYT